MLFSYIVLLGIQRRQSPIFFFDHLILPRDKGFFFHTPVSLHSRSSSSCTSATRRCREEELLLLKAIAESSMHYARSISTWAEMDRLTRSIESISAFLLPARIYLEAQFPITKSRKQKVFELDQAVRPKPLRC